MIRGSLELGTVVIGRRPLEGAETMLDRTKREDGYADQVTLKTRRTVGMTECGRVGVALWAHPASLSCHNVR